MSTKFSERLLPELVFIASRSGGPGGQNVNKVNTKVTVQFDVKGSRQLSDQQKELLVDKLRSLITGEGLLVLSAQTHRSQLRNKEEVLLKFDRVIAKAFHRPKPRKKTKPSKGSVQRRMESKKRRSETKKWRRRM